MKTILKEDDFIRNQVFKASRKIFNSLRRILWFIALPICFGFSALLYYLDPDRYFQYISPILIVPFLALLFASIPWLLSHTHNRWIINESVIKFRGDTYGSIKIDKIGEWFIKSYDDLPEYYRLTVRGINRMSSASIILSEKEYPIEDLTCFLPGNKQTEL